MNPVRFTLPLPPSANTIWRHGAKKVFTSKAYLAWKGMVASLIPKGHFPGRVHVAIMVCLPNNRSDLDNRIKPLLDALKKGLIDDDVQVWGISAEKFIDKENPRVEVEISPHWSEEVGGEA